MRKFLLMLFIIFGFVFAETPIVGNAYVISALGIKNSPNDVDYVSGDTSVSGNTNYVLSPQVIIYQEGLNYVGSYTPFTGCLNSQHYTNGAPDGMCITGIVNDLSTGGVDKALSAEQGKILNGRIFELASDIDSELYSIKFGDTGGKNLFNIDGYITNGLLNHVDGVLEYATYWLTTDYIEVESDTNYAYSIDDSADNYVVRYCEYDENKTFIKVTLNILGVHGNTTSIITTSPNAKYVRISFGRNNKDTTIQQWKNDGHWLQIEKGSQVTEYEPYIKSLQSLTESALNVDLLWTNANPTSSFAPQTISLDLSKYKFVIINFKPYYYYQDYDYNEVLLIGFNSLIIADDLNVTSNINRYKRRTKVSTDGVNFGKGYYEMIHELRVTIDNNALIPYQIYGVR